MTRRQAENIIFIQSNIIMFMVSLIICMIKPEINETKVLVITLLAIPFNVIFMCGIIEVIHRYNKINGIAR